MAESDTDERLSLRCWPKCVTRLTDSLLLVDRYGHSLYPGASVELSPTLRSPWMSRA